MLRFDKKIRAGGVGKTHWQRGFTLIEVVVSLALLAVMSMMAYQALVLVLETNQRGVQDGLTARAGAQIPFVQKALSNTMPSLASRSRFGVSLIFDP